MEQSDTDSTRYDDMLKQIQNEIKELKSQIRAKTK